MTINGLPAHVLLVHAIVVLLPLSAVLVILVAVWPAARDRLALPTALLATVTAVGVPITTEAGEWLEHRVTHTPLLRTHTHLGDDMLPWAIGLAIIAIALYLRYLLSIRQARAAATPSHGTASVGTVSSGTTTSSVSHQLGGTATTIVLAVVAILIAGGATYTIYQVGESGTRAAWTDRFSPTPLPRTHTAAPAHTSG